MNELWQWLDGRKTILGLILWATVQVLTDLGKLAPETSTWMLHVVYGWTGIGLVDKFRKAFEETSKKKTS